MPAISGDEKITLSVWGIPEYEPFYGLKEAVKEFDRIHPEISVQIGAPGGATDVSPQKLMTAVASGTPPDLILQDRFTISGWATRGAFRPLDDLIQRDGIDLSEFYEPCVKECMWQGELYGLPRGVDARGLYYNRDILKKFGYEKPPSDWGELLEYSEKMTVRRGRNDYEQVGFAPFWGNSWLYLYGWLNDGRFLSEDGTRCTLNDPRIVEALEYVKTVYDRIGGYNNLRGFQERGGFGGVVDPFINGKTVMLINGSWALDNIARYDPDMNFGVSFPPAPKGKEPLTWSGGFAAVIPAASQNVDQAWELAKWLTFEQGMVYIGEQQKKFNQSLGKDYYIPRFTSQPELNRKLFTRFPAPNKNVQEAIENFLAMLEHTKFRPVTPAGQKLWDEQVRATEQALTGSAAPGEALDRAAGRVQEELNRIYIPPEYPLLDWNIVAATGGAIMAFALLLWIRAIIRFRKRTRLYRKEAVAGILLASPWLFGFIVFIVGPMFISLVFSFCRYDGIHAPEFCGFDHFVRMFGFHQVPSIDGGTETAPRSPLFWKSLWNTGYITAIGVPFGLAIGLGLAMLVNVRTRGVKIYRALYYFPAVVPVVATAVIWGWLLHSRYGIVNRFLRPFFNEMNLSLPLWFDSPAWAKPALLLMILWTSGSTMIIWLAGLKSIPENLYEAARIDGAGAVNRFFRITLPMLSPYILFNMIISVISYLKIFTQPYVVSTPPSAGPSDSLLVYVFHLFNNAFSYFRMGFASAMAWILFVIILVLTLIQLRVSRRWVYYEKEDEF